MGLGCGLMAPAAIVGTEKAAVPSAVEAELVGDTMQAPQGGSLQVGSQGGRVFESAKGMKRLRDLQTEGGVPLAEKLIRWRRAPSL